MTDHNMNNLVDLIVDSKKTIIAIIASSILVSVIYALTATPIYRTSIYIIPPQDKDINALNVIDKEGRRLINDYLIRPQDVYTKFMVKAQSRKFQREFFFNNRLTEIFGGGDPEQSFEDFHKNLAFAIQSKILSREIREENFVTISILHDNSQESADILNDYIATVERKTAIELVAGVNRLLANKSDSIEGAVSAKISLARANTQDRIVQLKEALGIAEELGIIEMQIANNQQSVIMSDDNLLNSNPLYLYGTKALRVEIQTLLDRKSEDSFVPGLRALQQEVQALSQVKLTPGSIRVAQIDQKAMPSDMRHSPKRKLIVFLGTIFGIFLSLIYIFVTAVFIRRTN
jgi:chain length determinant protein (polysaccharide antigen chain regulator)